MLYCIGKRESIDTCLWTQANKSPGNDTELTSRMNAATHILKDCPTGHSGAASCWTRPMSPWSLAQSDSASDRSCVQRQEQPTTNAIYRIREAANPIRDR